MNYLLKRTKVLFKRTFQNVPSVYKKRINYYRAFHHIQRKDNISLYFINVFLYHISSFAESPLELYEMVLKSYESYMELYQYFNTDVMESFLESILSDMQETNFDIIKNMEE